MGIMPNEFWRMTPREFFACQEGHAARIKTAYRLQAYHLTYMLRAQTGQQFTIEQLMGESRTESISFSSGDDFRAHADALQAELDAKRARRKRAERR